MPGNTPLVAISSTSVTTEGVTRDVIRADGVGISLIISCFIDPSLFGMGFRFDANFQIVRVGDNQIASNNWWTQASGMSYPFSVDNFQQWGSNFWISLSNPQANNMGLSGGEADNAENGNPGMYIFRPYFFVDTSLYSQSLFEPFGTSQFALAAGHPFWVE